MKVCPYCKIEVGGSSKACPLCQSPLQGKTTEEFWPHTASEHKNSIRYKIALFAVISAVCILFVVDFLVLDNKHSHFSLPTTALILAVFWLITVIYIKSHNFPKMLFFTMVIYCILSVYLGWFYGFSALAGNYLIPIIVCATLILNFIFSFFDKSFKNNFLVYILLNILVGVVPYVVLYVRAGKPSVPWVVCLISSIVTFVGLVVFKGKTVWVEMQKRLHI